MIYPIKSFPEISINYISHYYSICYNETAYISLGLRVVMLDVECSFESPRPLRLQHSGLILPIKIKISKFRFKYSFHFAMEVSLYVL